jgi:hypothetical protein
MDNFKLIMIAQNYSVERAFGNHFEVPLNSNLAFRKSQMRDQRRNRQAVGQIVMIVAIDDEVHGRPASALRVNLAYQPIERPLVERCL